ncbi:acylphosphatase [Aurantiacibacter spongiae]|uniref:acylphosphatase n=1 Tax=Aurantiacibacter spongiae TaxID=2488860 RepID=A0A3N5CVN9_9SPHN|nr:acylphosphatase [Aurantiacibacter spongiae]RPF72416.1 acylphosphatase [Aurantiacibacter spongiae]
MIATRLIVRGTVQGVFYRDWTVRNARELGVAGWVRNLPDGTVEAHLQGAAEAVETLASRMLDGPPSARVARIEREAAEADGLAGFERR